MPGLLDVLNTDDARLGLGLLAAAGPSPYGFGQRLQGALSGFDDYKKDQARSKYFDTQAQVGLLGLQKAQRDAATELAIQEAARQSMTLPGQDAMKLGPALIGEQPEAMKLGPMIPGAPAETMKLGPFTPDSPQVAPTFDSRAFLQRLYAIDPLKAVEMEQRLAKDNTPLTVAPGASLVDRRTMRPIFTAPKEPDLPSAVREYEFARSQGYNGSFAQWQLEQKKAGATNVNVNTEKNLLGGIADGVSKGISEARGGAQAALGTINTVNRLTDALDSGQVMAGPGTSFRQFGLQLGSMLGVAGKDAQEKLLTTRQTIQSLAQLELDAAQQMKGQGQITEAERSIIRRAASGDIDSMTVPELRLLAGVLDRTARFKIQGFNAQVKPLAGNPNAAPLVPFLNVEEPPARQAPNVLRFDARGNPVK